MVICLALLLEMQTPRLDGTYRLNIAAFAFLATLLLIIRTRQAAQNLYIAFSGAMAVLTIYCIWCLGTFMWSQNAADTIIDSTILIITVGIAVSYAHVSAMDFAQEFVRVAVALAVASWALLLIAPHIAVLPDITWRLNGPMQHSQRLALVMGAALVVLTILRFRYRSDFTRPVWTASIYLLLTATLLATQARAFIAFTFIVLWFLIFGRASSRQRILLAIAMLIAVVTAWQNSDQLLSAIERDGSNTLTLTGRTVIWENSLGLIRENPILGYGFSSFYSDLTRYFFSSGYIPPHAHNSWINATFETGIIGATLLTLFMLSLLWHGSLTRPSLASGLIFFAMLCGLTGLVFGGKVSTLWVIIAILAAQETLSRRSSHNQASTLSPRSVT
ncbi:hypothetical protein ACNUDN_01520 [Mycobacterium sp. smrl_JER01]